MLTIDKQLLEELQKDKTFYMIGKLVEGKECELVSIEKTKPPKLKFYVKTLISDCQSTELYNKEYLHGNVEFADKYVGLEDVMRTLPANASTDTNYKYIQENAKGSLVIFKPRLSLNKCSKFSLYKNCESAYLRKSIYSNYTHFTRIPKCTIAFGDFKEEAKTELSIDLPEFPQSLGKPRYICCYDYIIDLSNLEVVLTQTGIKVKASDKINYVSASQVIDKNICTTHTIFLPTEILNKLFQERNINQNEANFIEQLIQQTLSEQLYYNKDDIINLHTCVKTNYLNILTGPTGTGKTQLARSYAKALGCNEENYTLLHVPIKPSFLTPEDFIGKVNEQTLCYVPANTGIVKFLQEAEANPDKIYICILDEMNLSHTEYWFTDFLSIMEMKDKVIYLYDRDLNIINKDKYKAEIKIGDNIRFIGTLNLDVDSKALTDRLLDRVNLIEIGYTSFISLTNKEHKESSDNLNVKPSATEYNSWVNLVDIKELSTEELHFFDKLQTLLIDINSYKGISYRVLNAITKQINNSTLKHEDILDQQVKQRILSKLKGEDLLVDNIYEDLHTALTKQPIIQLLKSYNQLSHFNLSIKYLERQIKDVFKWIQ